MSSKEHIEKVEELRIKLYEIMDDKNDLLDAELLEMSQKIDKQLNKYLKEKNTCKKI